MNKRKLPRFESLAKRLVEGSFSRLFGGQLLPLEIAARLARAMEDSQADGLAADRYRVLLHPDDYGALTADYPQAAGELAAYLVQLAQQADLALSSRPEVTLVAVPALGRHEIRLEAEHGPQAGGSTQVLSSSRGAHALKLLQAVDAFLIVEGKRHVPLDRSLMSIGRRADNDVVVDDPAVSRRHAQIRWRYGRFVIYDLGSRGGTAVNGQQVSESALHAGDVITLSGVPLIYGEELARADELRRPSPTGEGQKTLTLPRHEE